MSCVGRKQSLGSSEEAVEAKSSKDHWILGISRISQKEGGSDGVGRLKLRHRRGTGKKPIQHPKLNAISPSLPSTT